MRLRLIAVLAVSAALVAACGDDGNKDESEAITPGGEFVFGLEAEADGLSPTVSRYAVTGHLVASAVFDPLASFDADSNVVPFLAESIEPSEDFKTWTITLRNGVTFHDDTPLDAAIVERNLEAHMKSVLTNTAIADVESVTVMDPLTVVVKMKQPWASFDYVLTTQVGYVQAAAMLDAGPAGANDPIGTGPFVFESWAQGDTWTGVKNENYWRQGLPHIDRITFRTIPDDLTRESALRTGDVDMVHTDYGPSVATFKQGLDGMQLFEDTEGEEEFVMLNLAKPPFDNLKARQAVAYATDLDRYATTVGAGVLEPVNGPFAEGQLGYLEDTGYPEYDLVEARKLVEQYTAETGQPLKFSLASVPTPQGLTEIQLLADMWSEAGMEVELETFEQSLHIVRVITGDYQAAYWRLFSAVDPDGDYVWWHGRNAVDPPDLSLNFARNRDAELDAALDRAHATKDPEIRDEAYAEASRRMAISLPYIWLSRVTWLYAANDSVHGLENMMGGGLGSLAAKTWVGEIWIDSSEG